MQYKTIVLQLLQDRPEIHERLRKQQMLLSTVESYASQLKTRHEAWKEMLSQAKPGSDPSQVASEALEIALAELEDRLPFGSPRQDSEPLSLEAAMVFLRSHSLPA